MGMRRGRAAVEAWGKGWSGGGAQGGVGVENPLGTGEVGTSWEFNKESFIISGDNRINLGMPAINTSTVSRM